MPSATHEVIGKIAAQETTRMLELLGIQIQGNVHRPDKSDFKNFKPAERFADQLVTVGDPINLSVIFEVQLEVAKAKPATWVGYVASAFHLYKVPCLLVVLTNKRRVERWASLPIEAAYGQPLTLRVLGPSNFPKSFDAELVRQMPGLGVICALIHGPAPEAEEHYFDTLEAVAAAQRQDALDEETASLYIDLVVQKASKMWRKLMEEKVTTGPYLSDLMNRLHDQATRKGLEEGLEKGLEKG